jgi:hypothetical protein
VRLTIPALLVVLFATRPTWADEGGTDKPPPSPGGALARSALWTIVPAVAGGAGMLAGIESEQFGIFALGTTALGFGLGVGPNMGYYYAGEYGRTGRAVLRFLGVAGGTALLLAGSIKPGCTPDAPRYPDCPVLSVPMEIAGGALLAASGIWALFDVLGAPAAVRRANASGRTTTIVQPVIIRRQDSTAYGLALSGQF